MLRSSYPIHSYTQKPRIWGIPDSNKNIRIKKYWNLNESLEFIILYKYIINVALL